MSIVKLKKISIAGLETEKEVVIAKLQYFGQLHIIHSIGKSSNAEGNKGIVGSSDQKAIQAIRFLQQSGQKRKTLKHIENFNMSDVVDQTIKLKEDIRSLTDELEKINERTQVMRLWGDFDFPPEDSLGDLRFWFYILPKNKSSLLKDLTIPWQIVAENDHERYLILVNKEEPSSDVIGLERHHLGTRSLKQLLVVQDRLEIEMEEQQAQRYYLTRYLFEMRKHQVHADNSASFQLTLAQTENHHQQLFSLQAWIPINELKAFDLLATDLGIAYQAEDPADNEYPPTLLKPVKGFDSGALIASVYQLPAYRSWDPSVHLFTSFALFFSMIISDAGYALLLLSGLLIKWKKITRSDQGLALGQLMRFMFICATFWGILVGSYFGYEPGNAILQYLNIIQLNDYDAMMRLSILIGIGHIILANLSLAWNQRENRRFVMSRLGWIMVVSSGGAMWMADSILVKESIAPGCLIAGLLFVFLFSSQRKITNRKQGLLFIFDGIQSLASVTKLFGDVLSYMRLFALGLASASLGLTFNNLAANAIDQGQGIGVLAGALIFILGHLVNLLLGLMSGLVHGLRLNFIEFYNWGEPGEGYAYTRFLNKEISDE
jgi:V/A-type H+-transporting ATPase subunit I